SDLRRTRTKFGIDNFNVIPDIITMAKGVTSGYAPLGGMIISDRIHQELIEKTEGNFWHGYTYSGHPTAAAVGLKNLEIIKEEKLIEHVRVVGEQMLKGFEWIHEQNDHVVDVRAIGLLGAIGIGRKSDSADPIGPKIVAKALEKGVICRSIVYDHQDTLAFAPPFPITKAQMEEMINIVNDAIKAVD